MADQTKAGLGRDKAEAKANTRPQTPQGMFLRCGARKPPWARSRRKELAEKLRRMREGLREDD